MPTEIKSAAAYKNYTSWNKSVAKGGFSSSEQKIQNFLQSYFSDKNTFGLIVDVGANDGMTDSHSLPFIERGWEAVLIEPHPEMYGLIHLLYENTPRVKTINKAVHNKEETRMTLYGGHPGSIGHSTILPPDKQFSADVPFLDPLKTYEVTCARLTQILQESGLEREIDILHVDAEGLGLEVLYSLDYSIYSPKIISVDIMGPGHDGTIHDPLAIPLAKWMEKTGYEHVMTHAQSVWEKK